MENAASMKQVLGRVESERLHWSIYKAHMLAPTYVFAYVINNFHSGHALNRLLRSADATFRAHTKTTLLCTPTPQGS